MVASGSGSLRLSRPPLVMPRRSATCLTPRYSVVIVAFLAVDDSGRKAHDSGREIGTCELCETMLTAGAADQWVTCPVCGREQRAQTVKLRRLKTLCWDDSRRGSAAEIAKVFTDAGITVKRHTLTVWKSRGKLDVTPQGISYSSVYRLVISGGLDKELTVTA